MERALRYLFWVLTSLPAAFFILALIFFIRTRREYGFSRYLVSDTAISQERLFLFFYKTGNFLIGAIPPGFCVCFLLSILSYFLARHKLSLRHFYFQSICYIPYLFFVILMYFPEKNFVRWYISFLVN